MKNKSNVWLAAPLALALLAFSCKKAEFSVNAEMNDNETKGSIVKNYATDPAIEHGSREFLKLLNSGGTLLEKLPPEKARDVLVNAQASVACDYSGIKETEKTVTQDPFTISLNIVHPVNAEPNVPVFVFVHGGGWVLGDYPTHRRLVRDLVVLSGCAAVFVNYSRSPEAKYPIALNEIYAALKWVAANGNEIGVDGKRLAIVGNSAGGNMAAAVTLLSKERNGPEIKFVNLLWPVADTGFDTPSYHSFATDRFLTAAAMKWMFGNYTKSHAELNDYHIALVKATPEELSGFPPTLIQVAENDILRDEGELFGRNLDEAGIDVSTVRYNGTIHDFGLLNALAEQPSTRSMLEQAAAGLRKHLNP